MKPRECWCQHCRAYRRHAGRLRIGFASELFRNHSIGKTSSGLIAQLSRDRFEVFVVNLPGSSKTDDATRQWLRRHCDHWLTPEGTLEQVRQALADLKLDILFYQDIGMTSFSYLQRAAIIGSRSAGPCRSGMLYYSRIAGS